jgi:uncharacterized protein (DUF488 family)
VEKIYTIGHSTHEVDYFISLLRKHNINCICDVRSVPYSKYNSQFNKDKLLRKLNEHQIYYIPMGEELGARYSNRDLFDSDGIVDFAKVRETEKFKSGLKRLAQGVGRGFNIALMCSEKEPADCHRSILVSYSVKKMDYKINHILADGNLKTHDKLEEEISLEYKKQWLQGSLFNNSKTDNSLLQFAYKCKNKEIGYSKDLKSKKELLEA